MNAVIDKLPALIDEELAAANAKHPPFHSAHEGYAVILEEIEEVDLENKYVHDTLERLWGLVKLCDRPGIDMRAPVAAMAFHAQRAAAEMIQVAAMAQKMLVYLDSEKE